MPRLMTPNPKRRKALLNDITAKISEYFDHFPKGVSWGERDPGIFGLYTRAATLLGVDLPKNTTRDEVARLLEDKTKSRTDIALELGITTERVRQLVTAIEDERRHAALLEREKTKPFYERRIDYTELPARIKNVMRDQRVVTLGELKTLSRSELLRMDYLGKKSVLDIEEFFRIHE